MDYWYQSCSWDIGGQHLANQVCLLESHDCTRANLTHRLPALAEIKELSMLPSSPLSWAVQLSAATLGEDLNKLPEFRELAISLPTIREILLVSGNAASAMTDSFTLAKQLENWDIPLGFAVSPNDTPERIKQKCSTLGVKHLYLQYCSEVEELERLYTAIRKHSPTMAISACWLVPEETNWEALRQHPWRGAVLSEAWLDSYEYAKKAAQLQLTWMANHQVSPLIEPRILSSASFACAGQYIYAQERPAFLARAALRVINSAKTSASIKPRCLR